VLIEGYILDPFQLLLGISYQDDDTFPGASRLELYLFIFVFCVVWGIRRREDV
jgi:hypothetical protein